MHAVVQPIWEGLAVFAWCCLSDIPREHACGRRYESHSRSGEVVLIACDESAMRRYTAEPQRGSYAYAPARLPLRDRQHLENGKDAHLEMGPQQRNAKSDGDTLDRDRCVYVGEGVNAARASRLPEH